MKPRMTYVLAELCLSVVTGCAPHPPMQSLGEGNTQVHHTSTMALPHRVSVNENETSSPQAENPPPPSASLDVPAQHQLPELPNGCEVTSLSMLMTAVGDPIDKMTLAKEEPVDPTPIAYGPDGSISSWGDPNKGFVGKVNGYPGYGIYHGPIVALINKILPGKAVDLTGHPFTDILGVVAHHRPVMVWTTADFQPTSDWVTWNSPDGPVHATFSEHAVLLVGYNSTQLIINDPLDGAKSKPVNRQSFIAAWQQLGRQAVTIQR
jgi:uncharacterized protein YvpB